MSRFKVIFFLAIAFAWSWVNWFTGLHYLSNGINKITIDRFVTFFFIGVYGPAMSAIITSLCFEGFTGVLNLGKRLLRWKVSLKIYLFILLFPVIFLAIGIILYSLFIGKIGKFDSSAISNIPHILLLTFLAGPLGEEAGWRGILLPKFQQKYTAFKSSIIVGVVWFCWHIPLFLAPFGTLISGGPFSLLPFITYLAFVLCLSCIYTWLFNNTNGSVFITILIHASINAGLILLFFPGLNAGNKLIYLLATPAIILFTVYLGAKTGFDSKNGRARKTSV